MFDNKKPFAAAPELSVFDDASAGDAPVAVTFIEEDDDHIMSPKELETIKALLDELISEHGLGDRVETFINNNDASIAVVADTQADYNAFSAYFDAEMMGSDVEPEQVAFVAANMSRILN